MDKQIFEPGDTIILYCNEWPNEKQRMEIESRFKEKFPGAKDVLILPGGMKIEFVRAPK